MKLLPINQTQCALEFIYGPIKGVRTLPITSHHNDRLGFDSTPLETQILKLRGQWQADKDEKETFVHAKVRAPLQPESIPAIAEFAYQLFLLLCIACEWFNCVWICTFLRRISLPLLPLLLVTK